MAQLPNSLTSPEVVTMADPKFKVGERCKTAGMVVVIEYVKSYHDRLGHCYSVVTEDSKSSFDCYEGSLQKIESKEVKPGN